MNWNDTFRAALVEPDSTKVLALIHETEIAMKARSESTPKISDDEFVAISDATRALHVLKGHMLAGSS